MLLTTDDLGIPRFTNQHLIDMIYSGHIDKCHVVLCDEDDDIKQFNQAMEEQGLEPLQLYIPLDVDKKTFDGVCQNEWLMPEKYKRISDQELYHVFIANCVSDEQRLRVVEEYNEYQQREMLPLLKYLIYLVDFMKEHDIVWGVGRGSSVASYILYLIGIHRIDSIKYNLDFREFLR